MYTLTVEKPVSNKALWASRIMGGIAILFLLFDSVIHIMRIAPVEETSRQLGYAPELAVPLGILELILLIVYVIPRTSVAGAILLTGYLGGAIAAHVRVGSPLFSHVLFPVYVAILLWGALYLRDKRVQEIFSFERTF
ncbi:MAG TPA: DoxX family protein [Patescibacteria group bacterium]|nr:DoxX family protein [Patescibacteria group bacterium]